MDKTIKSLYEELNCSEKELRTFLVMKMQGASHQEIAEEIGSYRIAINRIFKKFKALKKGEKQKLLIEIFLEDTKWLKLIK